MVCQLFSSNRFTPRPLGCVESSSQVSKARPPAQHCLGMESHDEANEKGWLLFAALEGLQDDDDYTNGCYASTDT